VTDNPIIANLLPKGYSILHIPRKSRGGGVAIVHRDNLAIKKINCDKKYDSFESLECTLQSSVMARLCVIYRPPGSASSRTFFREFTDYMSNAVTSLGQLLVVGDFNFHINNTSDNDAAGFLDVCNSLNLKQHVAGPTHRSGNTLDLVLTRIEDNLIKSTQSKDYGYPDHYPVFISVCLAKPQLPTRQVTYRSVKSLNIENLCETIIIQLIIF
jgi:hypothetical protein